MGTNVSEKIIRDIRISARVSKSLKDRFVEKAEEIGLNETKAVTLLAEKFIKGEISLDNIESDRVERLEEEIKLMKIRLESIEESRKGELIASAKI
jgi:antitoxin component of RelBE/YafQ-DinJ toxin-antitoxin module